MWVFSSWRGNPLFIVKIQQMATPTISLPIKDIARQFGFVDAGIARPQRPDHFKTYLGWLLDGHAADMVYLAQERAIAARENPCLLLPECRSILVVVARYPIPLETEDQLIHPYHGKVAAYAVGEDYHTILIEKLEELGTELAVLSHSPVSFRAFTDSGPLLERELAFNAGLGWIGRNSCLISPEYGSYTFLAELLTDLPLESQEPIICDHCGNCHRCVDACPTHCILPNRTIAAERCLSYLTIENRGVIPQELRSSLGDQIFGCDICQKVCPWNRKVDNSGVDGKFLATDHLKMLDLAKEMQLSETDFKRIYQSSPILRAKRSGYLRNIALAIGNHRSPDTCDILLRVIHEEEDPLIRTAAVWAIGQNIDEQVREELVACLEEEKDVSVRREIIQVLNAGK
jgi:epoxyqueuosine reductase